MGQVCFDGAGGVGQSTQESTNTFEASFNASGRSFITADSLQTQAMRKQRK